MNEENTKEYEISFLLISPETEKELTTVLNNHKAEVFYQKPAAEINLAYKIKKHASAYFGFYHFRANPEAVLEIRRALSLNQGILRFLIISPPIKLPASQPQQPGRPEQRKAAPSLLSNEALSEKLEEILK